jgi:hypothetical protein
VRFDTEAMRNAVPVPSNSICISWIRVYLASILSEL